MQKEKLQKLTLTAMFSAIIIVMTFVPYLGYISIPGLLSITTLHIPVIIGAILLGPVGGFTLGTVWGITCLLYAIMNGTPDAPLFLNPLVSVLPRIIVGFLSAWYYKWFKKLTKRDPVAIPIAAVLTVITNTILVLIAMRLLEGGGIVAMGQTLLNIVTIAISLNGVLEIFAGGILATIITLAILRYTKRQRA